jgi:hypothetical protein
MRSLLLPVTVFILAANGYAAPPSDLAYKYCYNRNEWISSEGAKAAIAAEAAGKLSTAVFEEIWYSTCSEKSALEYSILAKKGEFDAAAFKAVIGKSCIGDSRLARPGAAEVAKAAAKKTLDVKTFVRLWDDACEFSPAFESAKLVKSGKLDEKAFHEYYSVVYDRCLGVAHGHGTEAQKIATGVKDGSIKREAFLQMMSKTCKFDSALAAGQRKLTRSPAFLAPISDDETEAPAE